LNGLSLVRKHNKKKLPEIGFVQNKQNLNDAATKQVYN